MESWLISVDQYIIHLYSAAMLLSIAFVSIDIRKDVFKVVKLKSFKGVSQEAKEKVITFCCFPLLMIIVELFSQAFYLLLWWIIEDNESGRQVWFGFWTICDAVIALMLIKIHNKLRIIIDIFSSLIIQAFLVKSFLHLITFFQLEVLSEIEVLTRLYQLGIPSINIGIGILLIIQSLKLSREKVDHGHLI